MPVRNREQVPREASWKRWHSIQTRKELIDGVHSKTPTLGTFRRNLPQRSPGVREERAWAPESDR